MYQTDLYQGLLCRNHGNLTSRQLVVRKVRFLKRKEKKLLKCIREDPQNLELYLKLGKLYFLNADYTRAADIYNRGLKINPQDKSLLFNSAVTSEALNRTGDAKELYLKILKIAPNYKPALERLAKITAF